MEKISRVEIPVLFHGDVPWLLLNHLSNTGLLRAASMSKPRRAHDPDAHHCDEISAKTSIRYHPKKWFI